MSKIKENSNHINNISNYLSHLINDIIHCSNDESLKINFETVNVCDLIEFTKNVAESYKKVMPGKHENLKIITSYDPNISNYNVTSDNSRLQQILLNLVSNAIKFTQVGYIIISAYFKDIDNKVLCISVEDSGIGMKDDDLKKLIDIEDKVISINNSFGLNKMGTGIGILLVKSIMKKLNHVLNIESTYLKGSKFEIIIKDIEKNKSDNEPENVIFNNNQFINNQKSNNNINTNEKLVDTTVMFNINDQNSSFINYDYNTLPKQYPLKNDESIKNYIYKKKIPTKKNKNSNIVLKSKIQSNLVQINVSDSNSKFIELDKINYTNGNFISGLSNCIEELNSSYESSDSNNRMNSINFNNIDFDESFNSNIDDIFINNNFEKNKILIVDDSKLIRKSTIKVFNQIPEFNFKFDVIEGTDGIDILKLIKDDQMNGNLIKLIISDENMEFMEGSTAFRILKDLEDQRKIKPIKKYSVTAFAGQIALNNMKMNGIDEIFNKPLSLETAKSILGSE